MEEKFLTYEALAEKKPKALSCADGLSDRRGRPKGLKNKIWPEIRRMLGEATLHYAHACFKEGENGSNCSEQGKIDKAKRCLKKAVRADPSDITLRFHLASFYVELGDYQRAAESYREIVQLCHENVEALKTGAKRSHLVYYSGEELPLNLKIRAGICHIHLGNMEKSEILLTVIQRESVSAHAELITEVADMFKSLEHFNAALKYYHLLEANDGVHNVANSALHTLKDNVDARLTFASLLLEDAKHEEAISLLTPPNKLENIYTNSDKSDAGRLNRRIKMKLCHIYRAKGYLRISPIHSCPWFVNHFAKRGDNQKTDSVYGGDRTEEKDDIGQVISVLTEIIMPDTCHTLGLVYDTIGNAEKAAGAQFEKDCPKTRYYAKKDCPKGANLIF
ncbi:hypothetical protein EZV62_003561 [Acer yangbiense]|uniref:Uncharacterized protein n=1 Tax=Acer yangbiense TaxID=1000413 RepID=A0A5C7IJK4_9ROSI|nr:hypothetical protein EZV62_003561 [Acer yangbiense]